MFRTLIRVAIVIFIAMLVFGGAEVTGFLSHAWGFVDHVIHGNKPTIHIPHLPKLPKLPTGSSG